MSTFRPDLNAPYLRGIAMNENDNTAEVIEPASETSETNATATEATKFYGEKPPKNQIIGKFYEAILDPKG